MEEYIYNFPKQFAKGVELAKDIKLGGSFSRAILCGMGGSIIPAEILYMPALNELNGLQTPNLSINRNFDLPPGVKNSELVICTSWSGNTKETISSYNSAKIKGLPIIVITKGGKLAELAKKDNVPLVMLPNESMPPRLAIGYMYSALVTILAGTGIVKDQSEMLQKLESALKPQNLDNQAKELADKISGKTPLNYASFTWKNQAAFWKIFFNENAKIHSFWNAFPGMAHQEIAGFNEKDGDKFFVILLRDPDDDPRQNELVKKLDKILEQLGYMRDTIDFHGKTILEKVFNNYLLAALTSMHLAKNLGVDPEAIEVIEKFKKM